MMSTRQSAALLAGEMEIPPRSSLPGLSRQSMGCLGIAWTTGTSPVVTGWWGLCLLAGNGGFCFRGNDIADFAEMTWGWNGPSEPDPSFLAREVKAPHPPALVIAGLVPAIHGVSQNPMDHRDEPGGDGVVGVVCRGRKRRFLLVAGMTSRISRK